MPAQIATGSVVAGFRVISLIGEGAMGAVYLAEAVSGGGRVALKLLGPELVRDERFRQRFLRESQLAASLEDPHIVPIVGSGEQDGVLYLAMAHVDGSDLRELLRREGTLTPERALELVSQVAAALDKAHEAGLVHRDVKPGNILVTAGPDGEHAYVCDFGLARHVSSVSSLTGERGFVGTIDYVPPEQIEGGTIDRRADVYSLGCVLFECLAGERPFVRDSELSVVFAHLNEPPPRLTSVRPELPDAFDTVVATALAKSPDERYGSCGELSDAARGALHGRVIARRRRRRNRRVLVGAVLLALAGATIGGIFAARGAHGHSRAPTKRQTISLAASALNLIDAPTHRVVGRAGVGTRVPVGDLNWEVAFTPGAAWVLLAGEQRLVRVDLATRKITASVKLPWPPGGRIATGGGSVWVTQDLGSELVRIDGQTAKIAARFTFEGESIGPGIAYGAGSLWLALGGSGVARVDPRNGRILRRYHAPAWWLVFADAAVWAARAGDGSVFKIDPVENRVAAQTRLHGWLTDLAVGGGALWAAVIPDGVVFELREDDLAVQGSTSTGPDPERLSFGSGRLWIANSSAKSVSVLEPASKTRQELAAEAEPATVAYHNGVVWVGAAPGLAALPRIAGQELRVSTPTDSAVTNDPSGGGLSHEQIVYATCANLLGYPESAGPGGAQLRPEIAASMPTVSNGGRTYTFRVRGGFRFSPPSNEVVTAATFRHTLERSLAPENRWSEGPRYASDIVGVSAFRAGKSAHISGITVRGDALSITLLKPAGDFLTRISMLWFCPVPSSIPVHRKAYIFTPFPSTGPYYISSIEGNRAVLVRNPNYPGDRRRRSERIVYTNDIPTPKAIALTDRGNIDLLPQDFDGTTLLLLPGGTIDRRHGAGSAAARAGKQRFFLYSAPLVDYIVLNTRRPLFRDVRLRRAVNYALDRRALAASFADGPADQIVSPAVPGYRAGSVYPLRSTLASARRLAGGRSRRATVYFCGNPGERKVARLVKRDLARIRIAVSIVESQDCPGPYQRADLILQSFLGSDERDPAPFLEQALTSSVFGTPLGPGPWNESSYRRRLERASLLRGDARTRAYAELSRDFARMAPFAVYGTFVWSQYVSPNVGCEVFLAEYGFLDLGALCKKS